MLNRSKSISAAKLLLHLYKDSGRTNLFNKLSKFLADSLETGKNIIIC